jgi:multidrug efflux pump subunit AcrB
MAARGITLNQLSALLSRLNVVSSAGEITSGTESIRLHPTGEFENLDELAISSSRLPAPGRRRVCGISPRCRAG